MGGISFTVGEYNISVIKQGNIFSAKINNKDFWLVGSEENIIKFLKDKKNVKRILSRNMRKYWISNESKIEGAMPDNSPLVGLEK